MGNQIHTYENPENGCFYRIVDAEERDVFLNNPDNYGLPARNIENPHGMPELLMSAKLKDKKAMRFTFARENAKHYYAKGVHVGLIVVSRDCLDPDDYDRVDKTGDILVEAHAATQAGHYEPFD